MASDPLRAISNRVKNMLARMVVKLVDDSMKMQLIQTAGLLVDGSQEVRAGIERFQNYGFTSVPLEGAEAAVLFLEGRRDHGICIAVDDRRYRLKGLQNGEVGMYTDQGDSIVIKRGGTIEITAATAVEICGSTAHVAKGESLNTAVANLGTAIAGALTTMGAGGSTPMPGTLAVTAGTTITTAVTAFNTAAANALSTKVKLS